MDLQQGQFIEEKRRITDADIRMFADICGDHNPIHVDEKAGLESVFKRRVAHGAFLCSLISAMIGMRFPGEGTIYLEQDAKFINPVYIDDEIVIRVVLSEILNPIKGIVRLETKILKSDDTCAVDGFAIVKVSK